MSEYPVVLEAGELIWTAVGYLTHGAMLGLQLALTAYLLATGVRAFREPVRSGFGFLRIVLGGLLLLPAAIQAPWQVSFLAMVGTIALLTVLERAPPARGRRLARGATAAAALVAVFSVWEADDPVALGGRVLFKMQEWRTHELDWQLSNDTLSPKVGQLAPDFALSDPSGARTTRLSTFRGKRPVALVFGSYT